MCSNINTHICNHVTLDNVDNTDDVMLLSDNRLSYSNTCTRICNHVTPDVTLKPH